MQLGFSLGQSYLEGQQQSLDLDGPTFQVSILFPLRTVHIEFFFVFVLKMLCVTTVLLWKLQLNYCDLC